MDLWIFFLICSIFLWQVPMLDIWTNAIRLSTSLLLHCAGEKHFLLFVGRFLFFSNLFTINFTNITDIYSTYFHKFLPYSSPGDKKLIAFIGKLSHYNCNQILNWLQIIDLPTKIIFVVVSFCLIMNWFSHWLVNT